MATENYPSCSIGTSWKKYLIIGAGKTGLDAILYLLDKGVNRDKIHWVISNDCWFLNRSYFVPDKIAGFMKELSGSILIKKDMNDACASLEKKGIFTRLDLNIWPSRMRFATVCLEEMKT